MRANAECSLANAWHAKSNVNPTAVIDPFILFSRYSGRRKSGHIQMGSGESVSNRLYLKFATASPFGSRRRRISERNLVETGADDRLNRLTRVRKRVYGTKVTQRQAAAFSSAEPKFAFRYIQLFRLDQSFFRPPLRLRQRKMWFRCSHGIAQGLDSMGPRSSTDSNCSRSSSARSSSTSTTSPV